MAPRTWLRALSSKLLRLCCSRPCFSALRRISSSLLPRVCHAHSLWPTSLQRKLKSPEPEPDSRLGGFDEAELDPEELPDEPEEDDPDELPWRVLGLLPELLLPWLLPDDPEDDPLEPD